MSETEARKAFEGYFAIFPWADLSENAEGFDMGCGSGRWARWVASKVNTVELTPPPNGGGLDVGRPEGSEASDLTRPLPNPPPLGEGTITPNSTVLAPKVGRLHCIDPSDAIEVAKTNLAEYGNVVFHRASVDEGCLPAGSQDFGYSLGVLHHVPDTEAAIRSCVELLKPGAPLLLYLYYAFDNRPGWFRALWRVSDWGRRVIYRLPPGLKHAVTDVIALLVYWPLARISGILERLGVNVDTIPLSFYRAHSFYTLRTDARDRFGTPLEQRFTRQQIKGMMERGGLTDIRFSESAPFWCAVGVKERAE